MIDTKRPSISLSKDRQAKLKAHVSAFLQRTRATGVCTLGELDTLTGKLANAAYVLHGGRASLSPLYKARFAAIGLDAMSDSPYPPKHTKVPLDASVFVGLDWWYQQLTERSVISRPLYVFSDGSMNI